MVMVFIDGSRRDSEEFAFRPRRLCDSAVVPGELRKWTVLTGIITSREKGWLIVFMSCRSGTNSISLHYLVASFMIL